MLPKNIALFSISLFNIEDEMNNIILPDKTLIFTESEQFDKVKNFYINGIVYNDAEIKKNFIKELSKLETINEDDENTVERKDFNAMTTKELCHLTLQKTLIDHFSQMENGGSNVYTLDDLTDMDIETLCSLFLLKTEPIGLPLVIREEELLVEDKDPIRRTLIPPEFKTEVIDKILWGELGFSSYGPFTFIENIGSSKNMLPKFPFYLKETKGEWKLIQLRTEKKTKKIMKSYTTKPILARVCLDILQTINIEEVWSYITLLGYVPNKTSIKNTKTLTNNNILVNLPLIIKKIEEI